MKVLNFLACLLVIVGALNWGLIGFFDFNLVTTIFANMEMAVRVVYCAVGVAAVWMALSCFKKCGK